MSTSTLGWYSRFDEALVDDEDPVDTGHAYRAVNNLNHLADQYAQHRVNWILAAGEQGLAIDASDTLDTTNDFFLYRTAAAFDLHVREDGTSYRCACWLYVHSGHATHQAVFKAALVPAASGITRPDLEIATGGVNVADCNRIGTTFQQEQLDALMYLDAPRVRDAGELVSTIDSIGGSVVTVQKLAVRLHVYVSVNNMGAAPRLGGVRLVEYMAP